MKRAIALTWAAPDSPTALARQQQHAMLILEGVFEDIGGRAAPIANGWDLAFTDGTTARVQIQPEAGAAQVTIVLDATNGSLAASQDAEENVRLTVGIAAGQFRPIGARTHVEWLNEAEHGPFEWLAQPYRPARALTRGDGGPELAAKIAAALPEEEGDFYSRGFRDCLESTLLHLESMGVGASERHALVDTVLDAFANNDSETPVAYMVLQEGDAGDEKHVHVAATRDDAKAFRIECGEDSYRTSGIITVPPAIAALGEPAYAFIQDVLTEAEVMSYPVYADHGSRAGWEADDDGEAIVAPSGPAP